jgi:uncharacterized protein YkwD
MSASHRATGGLRGPQGEASRAGLAGRAQFRAGRFAMLRLLLAVGLGVVLFGGAAYGGSRMLGGDSAPGRSVAAALAPTTAAPDAPTDPADATSVETAPSPSASAEAATPTPTKPKPTQRTTTPAPAAAGPVAEVLRLVNLERTKAGCGALTTDSRLATAAQAHSADMAANNYFSHTGRNGSDVSDRVEAAGYRWSAVGENIAKGQPTPAAVMQAWMNSSGHRANILNCRFRNIGIGLANAGRSPVWTQDFGTPR